MRESIRRRLALAGACGTVFWPGAFIFSLPGVMGGTWQSAFMVGRASVGRTLFFVLAAVGVFMFLVGRWQERTGPRPLVAFGAILCGVSTAFLGRATGMGWVHLWAFAVGASSAFMYIPALTVVQEWYPERRGLVSGVVNLGFGLSAAIMAPLFGRLLQEVGPGTMTAVFGVLALFSGLAVAPLVRRPGPSIPTGKPSPATHPSLPSDVTVSTALRTRSFWCLWGVWALAGGAGISMVTLSIAFGTAKGLSVPDALILLTVFNLTNGGSRLISGYLSDRTGRRFVMGVSFAAAGLAYWAFPLVRGLGPWAFMAAVVGFAFGTLFAVSGPLAVDRFGMRHFGAIFGLVFTAYGFLAGLLGPWFSGLLLDRTGGNFSLVFRYLGLFFVLSALLVYFVKPISPGQPRGDGPSRSKASDRP